MKAIIMAGGKGTRISTVNSELPKPMIPILNKPILEYQIECLKGQGITDITLIIGHLKSAIQEYFGNGRKVSPATNESFNVDITYIIEEEPLGTAGALYLLKDKLNEDFLLINGDIIFDIYIEPFLQFHKKNKALATLLTHPNNHPYDSGIIIADENGLVENWLHKEDERLWYQNRVNAGIHLLSPKIFLEAAKHNIFTSLKKTDLDRDVLKPLIDTKKLFAYDSPEYVKDMGTPDRYHAVIEDIRTGKVKAKNLLNKQKAIFLDRDGTINEHIGFLNNIEDFRLLPKVSEAIAKINQSGYLAIVVTNQPVIARGELSLEGLQEIHNKLETLLGDDGAYVDGIYFCPHHPHKGYEGERIEYKIDCECRKPKAGMLFDAAKRFNIDLSHSWMIGDRDNDIEAGKKAGCMTAYIGTDLYLKEDVETYSSLLDCINNIL